ncbi:MULTISPECIES: AraC family transcriptional regulator [unclassified Pseudoalteromonas]|uniref:AraC family transcriptional regulator n=1 Tax=unclassified Pseudoalteromonas TaxID=194690 RepID=UPI003014AC55
MHSTSYIYFYSAYQALIQRLPQGETLFSDFHPLVDVRPERVPVSSYDALLEQASKYSQQALIGFELGRDIQLADYGVLGYLVETCDTLQQALQALCRYDALVADIGRVKFDSDGDVMTIVWQLNTAVGKQTILRNMTAWVSAARQVLKSQLAPSGLSLNFALTDSERQQLCSWFGCEIHPNAEQNAIHFPRDYLSIPLISANKQLNQHMDQMAALGLQQLQQQQLLAPRVTQVLQAKQSLDAVVQSAIAKLFNLSVRSLQRQLQREQQSFRGLLEQERKRRFETMIAHAPLSEIVAELGFVEQSALNKFCQKQYGQTPTALRLMYRDSS